MSERAYAQDEEELSFPVAGGDAQDRREAAGGDATDSVRHYLNRIGRVALLNAEQEVDLAKRMEAGLFAGKLLSAWTDPEHPDAERLADRDRLARELRYGPAPDNSDKQYEGWLKLPVRAKDRAVVDTLLEKWADTQAQRRDLAALQRDGERAATVMTESNLRLVVSMARRYTGRGLAMADLIQEGNLGLIRAVGKFDYAKGFKFSTYATWWIRQAVTRAIADQARVIRLPTGVAEQTTKLGGIQRRLSQELGRKPTTDELAEEMNVSTGKIIDLLGLVEQEPISFDKAVGDSGDDVPLGNYIEDADAPNVIEAMSFNDMTRQLDKLLGLLADERERAVVRMHFGIGQPEGQPLTLDQIGQKFGVTRERMRQIEKQAMGILRRKAPEDFAGLREYLD